MVCRNRKRDGVVREGRSYLFSAMLQLFISDINMKWTQNRRQEERSREREGKKTQDRML